jgi:hypothetical protein
MNGGKIYSGKHMQSKSLSNKAQNSLNDIRPTFTSGVTTHVYENLIKPKNPSTV